MEDADVDFVCCFCGTVRDDTDGITISALWTDDGREQQQFWPAHRACLIERMTVETRELFGGPLFGN